MQVGHGLAEGVHVGQSVGCIRLRERHTSQKDAAVYGEGGQWGVEGGRVGRRHLQRVVAEC